MITRNECKIELNSSEVLVRAGMLMGHTQTISLPLLGIQENAFCVIRKTIIYT